MLTIASYVHFFSFIMSCIFAAQRNIKRRSVAYPISVKYINNNIDLCIVMLVLLSVLIKFAFCKLYDFRKSLIFIFL